MHCCPLVRHWADGPRKKHRGINVRDMKNEGGGGMQTTMSLNCNSQSMTFILSDAIIISYSKIYSDCSKREAVTSFIFRLNWNMEPKTSISCSQEPATESYFEPVESSPHSIPLRYILTVRTEVCLGLKCDFFHSVLQTEIYFVCLSHVAHVCYILHPFHKLLFVHS